MRTRRSSGRRIATVLAAMPVATAWAQDGTTPAEPEAVPAPAVAPIEVRLTPGVWIPRLLGDVRLGDGPLAFDVDLEDQLDLRDREATVNVELEVRKQGSPWHLHFDGYHFETDNADRFIGNADFGSLQLRDGDPFRAEMEILSFSGEFGYVMLDAFADDPKVDLRLGPVFALRYVDIDHEVEQIGVGTESPDGDWLGALVGLQFDMIHDLDEGFPLLDKVALRANVAAGPVLGGDGGVMYHLRAGMDLYFTDSLALYFGFRLLEVDAETNDGFEMDGGLQGLFLGASITF
jgi:hypothetical protein